MQNKLPVIVFAGAVYPGQFGALCDYMRSQGLAETYFLTTPGYHERSRDRGEHILAFRPDGPIVGEVGYYYTRKVERSARIARGLHDALLQFQQMRKIDVVCCHSLWGAPHMLYDELDAAIVSYIEFPSYRAHGWDPDYPPDLAQRRADRGMEMLHYQQVLSSDLTVTPSAYAKSLFPVELRPRIEAQFEGFIPDSEMAGPIAQPRADGGPVTIGFTARDLSNSKGVDIYFRLVERLLDEGIEARFVAMGDPNASTYGYEQQWVQREYKGEVANFCEHLARRYPRAGAAIEFAGELPYADYVRRLSEIDIFLYPLRFGVGNWGLMEILLRGGCVIAPDRGYTAEMIASGVNGTLLPDDDTRWIAEIRALAADPQRRLRYGRAAQQMARSFHMDVVAQAYLGLFRKAITNRERRLSGSRV